MTSLRLAATCCGIWFYGCSGVEELALNPNGPGTAGGAGQPSGGAGGARTSGGPSTVAGTPSNTGGVSNGGQTTAGTAGATFDGAGAAAAGTAGALPCSSDSSCLAAAAPHCRADGRCVTCVSDANCSGETLHCDLPTGACVEIECGSSSGAGGCGDP